MENLLDCLTLTKKRCTLTLHVPLHFLAKFTRKCKLLTLGKNNPRQQDVLGATQSKSSLSDKAPGWNSEAAARAGHLGCTGSSDRRGSFPSLQHDRDHSWSAVPSAGETWTHWEVQRRAMKMTKGLEHPSCGERPGVLVLLSLEKAQRGAHQHI